MTAPRTRGTLAARTILAGTAALAFAGMARAQVEIEYWQYYFEARVDAMDILIENFEAANPGITVVMTTFPYADYRTKVAASIPAGEGPDVVQLFYGWLNDYVEAELIQPLPSDVFAAADIESEFFPMVQAMKIDGDYWALPTAVRSLALFYNERLLEAAGIEAPATTLEELAEHAALMTERDGAGNITTEGLTTGMGGQDHHWLREVLFRQYGATPYSDDYRTVGYATPEGVAALEWYMSLQLGDDAVSNNTFMDEAQAAFKAGRAGYHIDGSFRIGALEDSRGLNWGVTELPAGPDGTQSNYSSYWVNAITSGAQDEEYDAAVLFMEYVTSDEAMQVWVDTVGELPAKPSAAEVASDDPVFGPFVRGLEYAHTTIFADESAQRQILTDAVSRIELEGQSVADSLAQAQQEEQALLDSYYTE